MYQSPFSTRYGSNEMRAVWSEAARRRTWRRIWLAVAEVQASAGLITPAQIEDLRAHLDTVDVERAAVLEAEIGHDVMAELRAFAEQCPVGGGVLHWGLTSADLQDNADVARQRAALGLVLGRLRGVLLAFAQRIDATADLAVLGYTHLQPAEPTTLGYRLAITAQDLLGHFESLARVRVQLRGKGIRGAVGTGAAFVEMLQGTGVTPEALEASVLHALGLEAYPVVTQTYPRVQDYQLLSALSALAASLHKFAFDLRLMQSPGLGGIASEPFGERQVGSTAMPFKRNPVKAEQVCSLARLVASYSGVAWHNAADALLERTLDDSANRRSVIPEAFLAIEQMLINTEGIISGLQVDEVRAAELLEAHGPFAATERILSALVRAGADRQEVHERLRQHSRTAWEAVQDGKPNPLLNQLTTDTVLLRYAQPARMRDLLDVRGYVGQAPERARTLARTLRQRLGATEPA
jgi:adenylosuccinate lyase